MIWIVINSKLYIFFQVHRISQLINESPETKKSTVHHVPITCESPTDKRQNNINIHAPVPAPPADDMEPQNISFIGTVYLYIINNLTFRESLLFKNIIKIKMLNFN